MPATPNAVPRWLQRTPRWGLMASAPSVATTASAAAPTGTGTLASLRAEGPPRLERRAAPKEPEVVLAGDVERFRRAVIHGHTTLRRGRLSRRVANARRVRRAKTRAAPPRN